VEARGDGGKANGRMLRADFDKVLRVLDSIQLTAKHKVATPANWKQGGDVIIVRRFRTRKPSRNIPADGRR
jgi:alkyl hydroperoxide reductase subunit AhpC